MMLAKRCFLQRSVLWALALVAVASGLVQVARADLRPNAAARLAAVKSWAYQLQNYTPEMLDALAAADTDLVVIDYQRATGAPFTFQEIQRLKRKPDGGRRLVIAYLSIGEAEEYRFYWRPEWSTERPSFHITENCRWPRNHLVRYWDPKWRDLKFWAPDSYLAQIVWAGFDGVYLDRIDAHNDIVSRYPDAAEKMKRFVSDLAGTVRLRQPEFIVIAQNAEELLVDPAYRAVIDAVAKEDLLHGVYGTGRRNPEAMIAGSMENLRRMTADGKPIFAVEYLVDARQIETTRTELAALRIPTVFPTRALDGRDPLAIVERSGLPRYGTPEYAAVQCNGVFPKAE